MDYNELVNALRESLDYDEATAIETLYELKEEITAMLSEGVDEAEACEYFESETGLDEDYFCLLMTEDYI